MMEYKTILTADEKDEVTCETCRYWQRDVAGRPAGTCRRWPPKFDTSTESYYGHWPYCDELDWCGEWRS